MRQFDWANTSLGPVDRWPEPLRTSIKTSLDCAFPIVMWWGPDLTILYNDEYIPMLGPKHPSALGQPGSKVWTEIWDVIHPMLSRVFEHAEPTRSRDLLLHIDRGYSEEAYFSFSYSPIHVDGRVAGIFCPVLETTDKVIGERRLRTLRDLASTRQLAESEGATFRLASSVIAENPRDVPFALIYEIDDNRAAATLTATAGISAGSPAAPKRVELGSRTADPWRLGDVSQYGRAIAVEDLGTRFDDLPTGAWKTAPEMALALPVLLPGHERPHAVLVAAVSPMRALDDAYRTFYTLIAAQIASALADAHALDAERRRSADLAKLDRAKTAFFSNVSHEFRTPLTLMIGPLQDLLAAPRDDMSADVASSVDIALRNGLRLQKLVNTLLDFSRIEAGRIEANYEPTDLTSLTTELASVFRSAVEKAGLRLVVDCRPLPDPVYVDREMWEKIVLNLLSNALKFTFSGTITVSLRSTPEAVELSVTDTGIGIPIGDIDRVFERFHRARHSDSRSHEGTGIGLALVQELARLHGGSVSVTSHEGEGSRFVVRVRTGTSHLPADRISAGRHLESTSLAASAFVDEALSWLPSDVADNAGPLADVEFDTGPSPVPGAASDACVLIADDNADMRDYLRRLLGQHFRVETAADGDAALARIRATAPDLLLSDVMMPGLDGFDLLAAIRADKKLQALPVILLSARAGQEARIEGLRAGANDYLVKPFSARELIARVSSQLQLARLRADSDVALRHRSEQYETLLNRAPLGVFVLDSDFRILEVNPVALPVFGDVPGGLIGRDFGDVMHAIVDEPTARGITAEFRHTLETGHPFVTLEQGVHRIDRDVVEFYEWRVDRIGLAEGRTGVVCYFRDISDRKQMENDRSRLLHDVQEASHLKDAFLATLSHELRTPLNAIVGYAHMLRSGLLPLDRRPAAIETIERNAMSLAQIVEDVLDVSRIVTGKIRLQLQPVNLQDAVRHALDLSRPAADTKGVRLESFVDSKLPWVLGDLDRLHQVLWNLLSNAVKFTPAGGLIRVRAARVNSHVEIAVTDTGAGIPTDFLPHMFERFRQADAGISRKHGGLGLGLSIARQLAQLHGGSITAESAGLGKGSTFRLSLPIVLPLSVADESMRRTGPAPIQVPIHGPDLADLHRLHVLVVDDEPDALELVAEVLGAAGARVTTARSADEATEQLTHEVPDVLVADVGMPVIDGLTFISSVRHSTDERIRSIPAAALTAYARSDDRVRALNAGFSVHLAKPIDPTTLIATVAALAKVS